MAPLLGAARVVVRSDVQYSRQSWQNRTRVRNADGSQWLTVPVERGQFGLSIAETRIAYHDGWMTRHEKALRYNYATTPFYLHYADDFSALLRARPATLGELTIGSMALLLRWLGHTPSVEFGTEEPAPPGPPPGPYRQNYPGFIPGMSTLDILFNLGPHATRTLLSP